MYTALFLKLVLITALHQIANCQSNYDVRLVGVNVVKPRSGVVQVYFNGQWGLVCNQGWDTKDAAVVCYQLGYVRAQSNIANSNDPFFTDTGITTLTPRLFTGIQCDGNELSFQDCRRSQPATINCNNQFAAVYCLGAERSTTTPTTTTQEPTTTTTLPPRICNNPSTNVRLEDGANVAIGRVQIRQTAQSPWGEICDYLWDKADAQVICRMLCYNPGNARAFLGGTYGAPTGSYLLKNLRCVGTETNIYDCPTFALSNNCTALEAAAISCLEPPPTLPDLPTPIIECVGLFEEIKAVFPKATNPGLTPSNLNLTNNQPTSCGYTTGENTTHVFISIPFTNCGTLRTYNFTYIIYSNIIRHAITPQGSVITRTEVYNINVSCAMGRNGDPENEVDPRGRTAPPQQGEGHPNLQLVRSSSPDFLDNLTNHDVTLGQEAYFGLHLLTKDDTLKVILQQCYATPNISANSTPQYFLIFDKCANESSVRLHAINMTFFGFTFTSFKFFGEATSVVYLHCKGIVCGLDEFYPRCDRTCGTGVGVNRKKRSVDDLMDEDELTSDDLPESLMLSDHRERRALSHPYEIDVDSGPLRLVSAIVPGQSTRNRFEPTLPTTTVHSSNAIVIQPSSTTERRQGVDIQPPSTTESREGIDSGVQDLHQTSTATVLQFTLSILVCAATALLLH